MDADQNSATRGVDLTGTPEQIARAEQLINDVLAEAEAGGSGIVSRRTPAQTGSEQFVMRVPNNKVGLVIGKGGETIKSMQASTGARIQVVPLHLPPGDISIERSVHIDGTPEQVEAAKQMVTEVTSEVNATALHYQNQRLVQQLELKKHELQKLEDKTKEMQEQQDSYDDLLAKVNQQWNQLVDDLLLLRLRAGKDEGALEALDNAIRSRGLFSGSLPSCAPERIFLCRLLEKDSIAGTRNSETVGYIEEALARRCASTQGLMQVLEETITAEKLKTESLSQRLLENVSGEDGIILFSKIDDMIREEAKALSEAAEFIQEKLKDFRNSIQSYDTSDSADQSEIKRLEGELEELITELEESRRKLINLKMQKDVASGISSPTPGAVNGNLSPEKQADKTTRLRELKDFIEEMKILAADRLSELLDARESNSILSKQSQDLQNELRDDKYVLQSRLYTLLKEKFLHLNAEAERYRELTEAMQADRPFIMRREKELNAKLELVEVAKNAIGNVDSRIAELELQLQKSIVEKNDLEIKMEEAHQDSGRKDIKSEFRVMASALSKEMGMMEAQLNRWKGIAREAISLRGQAQSLRASLEKKRVERNSLVDKCENQIVEIKSLRVLVEKLTKEKMELSVFLDLYGNESSDRRNVSEIRESEQRSTAQAEVLRNALEEHNLELRVRAAYEAEVACQQRLHVAQEEITDLVTKLDASEREIAMLVEAIKMKEAEAETYISEIETIGQAYEDMQQQNQHLLQQMAERDDYNIKLVSDSVKTKQAQNALLSQKQALTKQLQQVNSSIESVKSRIGRCEEELKTLMTEAIRSTQEDRHLALSLETSKLELGDSEKELKWFKTQYALTEKEYDQTEHDKKEMKLKVQAERERRMRLEKELEAWNKKVVQLTAETGEAAVQRLQDEIKECRAVLKCSVCLDRPKEVVIVKCYHLFCNQCIQRNLEIRHRKCPACGTAFGQNDVRFVKI